MCRRLLLESLLTPFLVVGMYHACAAEDDNDTLAIRARAVFEKCCYACHGRAGKAKGGINYILDPAKLIDNGFLERGKPDESLIYQKITDRVEPMPPKDADPEIYPRPTADDISLIAEWIKAGAPTPAKSKPATDTASPGDSPPPTSKSVDTPPPFVSNRETLIAVRQFLEQQPREDRQYWRFFSLTHLHNLRLQDKVQAIDMPYYRAALSKAINSLSWSVEIVVPQLVDTQETVLAIDLRSLNWTHDRHWTAISRAYPYGLSHSRLPDDDASREAAAVIADFTKAEIPIVRGDWFVAVATRPPLYELLLDLPKNAKELEELLGVNVAENIQDGTARRAGFMHSGVSPNANRMVERHRSKHGAYWKSYDFLPNADRSNLLRFPLGPVLKDQQFPDAAFHHSGGEIIFNLPNGLQGYLLVNAADDQIPSGPPDLVSDDKLVSGSPLIVNGISCMACHDQGMKRGFKDEIREQNAMQGDARDLVKRLYPPADEFKKLIDGDEDRFLRALELATGPFLKTGDEKDKPIAKFAEPITGIASSYNNSELELAHIAAELGESDLEPLRQRILNDPDLMTLGLGPLTARGVIKREFWQSNHDGNSIFQLTALRLGVGVPRSVTSPIARSETQTTKP